MVTQQISAKVNDTEYYWDKTDLELLRGDDGVIDLTKADAAADELLSAHPSLRPTPGPIVASADAVNGSGLIGHGPRSALDTDNIAPEGVRTFAQFLTDAARGEPAPQQ